MVKLGEILHTTHIVLSPLDFLSRLASLIPRPRLNLIRFHGVFAPHFKHRSHVVPEVVESLPTDEENQIKGGSKKKSMTWAQRLKRVFGIDIEACANCQGKVKILAAIEDPPVIKQILTHLGLDTVVPRLSPSRGPPPLGEWSSI